MVGATATEWAAVSSAIAAAIAALASLASVRQSRRAWIAERTPELHMQAIAAADTRKVWLEVHNAGGGLAREIFFYFVEGEKVVAGHLPPNGMLAAGAGVRLSTELIKHGELTGRMIGAVVCADSGRNIHAWSATGANYKRWTSRSLKRHGVSNNDAVAAVLPELEQAHLEYVGFTEWTALP